MIALNKWKGEAFFVSLNPEQIAANFKDVFRGYDKGNNYMTAENLSIFMKKNKYSFIFENKHLGFYVIPPDQIPFADNFPNKDKLIGIGRKL